VPKRGLCPTCSNSVELCGSRDEESQSFQRQFSEGNENRRPLGITNGGCDWMRCGGDDKAELPWPVSR